ncbi:hypothetical protein TI05_13495 [Achromatium sp. WMS3]|nr:hypothetical protein TI05_13495 [Achromatium sp. WMS3]
MKETLTEMMIAMMPAMLPMVWAGAIILGVGLIVLVLNNPRPTLTFSGIVILILGIFFVAAQFMGQWLSMTPAINFGDPTKFEFILVPFWQIGAADIIAGIFLLVARKWV